MQPDFLVGMGGGKAIDTAKGVAHRLGIPLVSLPTLVSNCAPITALSVVYREDGPFDRFLFYDAPPALTLVDLNLAADAPARFFRAGWATHWPNTSNRRSAPGATSWAARSITCPPSA